MTKYFIHQIHLTDAEMKVLNTVGWDTAIAAVPRIRAYADRLEVRNTRAHWANGAYGVVAKIEAKDLDDVFRIGNIGPEDQIERFGRMSSISVGDIIENAENGAVYVVAPLGFESI